MSTLNKTQTRSITRGVSSLSSWIIGARPHTLCLSATPVALGAAIAWAVERKTNWLAVSAALIASLCIQIGTNLHNDAVDSKLGGDGPDRLGPPRVTATGLLTATAVKRGAALSFGIAALIGSYLVSIGGWPILLLGLFSIVSGWAYTAGPFPIAYTPFGEVFVLAFFGLGAVSGTYWLCAANLGSAAVIGGLALGSLTSAVLLVNNHRDAIVDARVGRRTLAILVGPFATICIFAGLVLTPIALLAPFGDALPRGHIWPALLILPLALRLAYRFACEPRGPGFNRILVQAAQVQSLFALLLCLGLLI